jgi:hypothetical protein
MHVKDPERNIGASVVGAYCGRGTPEHGGVMRPENKLPIQVFKEWGAKAFVYERITDGLEILGY